MRPRLLARLRDIVAFALALGVIFGATFFAHATHNPVLARAAESAE